MIEEYKERIDKWNSIINDLTEKRIEESTDAYNKRCNLNTNLVQKAKELWGGQLRVPCKPGEDADFERLDGDIADAILFEAIDTFEKITGNKIEDRILEDISRVLAEMKLRGLDSTREHIIRDAFVAYGDRWFYDYEISKDPSNIDFDYPIYRIIITINTSLDKYRAEFIDRIKDEVHEYEA